MPWKVCSARRNVFALRPISRQEDMSERTGSRISRKTGYKILSRYKEGRLCNHSPAVRVINLFCPTGSRG